MNGHRVVCDTNVVLFLLKGDKAVAAALAGRELVISQITRIELLSFAGISRAERKKIELFLETWPVESLHQSIEDITIELRKKHHCKLPDAVIAATASYLDIPLITADKGLLRMHEDAEVIFYDPDRS
jgi:predicted nucleic acid-binding protein